PGADVGNPDPFLARLIEAFEGVPDPLTGLAQGRAVGVQVALPLHPDLIGVGGDPDVAGLQHPLASGAECGSRGDHVGPAVAVAVVLPARVGRHRRRGRVAGTPPVRASAHVPPTVDACGRGAVPGTLRPAIAAPLTLGCGGPLPPAVRSALAVRAIGPAIRSTRAFAMGVGLLPVGGALPLDPTLR